jgi:hypothetical protein
MKDLVVRAPFWWMSKRPRHLAPPNEDRLPANASATVKQVPGNPLDPTNTGKGK